MPIIWAEGFEDPNWKNYLSTSGSTLVRPGRCGGSALGMNHATSSGITLVWPMDKAAPIGANTYWTLGWSFFHAGVPSETHSPMLLRSRNSRDYPVYMTIENNRGAVRMSVREDNTFLTSLQYWEDYLPARQWMNMRVVGTGMEAGDIVRLYIDGTLRWEHTLATGFPSLKLDGLAELYIKGMYPRSYLYPSQFRQRWDDIFLSMGDTTGVYIDDDVVIHTASPVADGTHSAWTPTAATHWESVKTADANYVSTTTSGARDSYAFGPAPDVSSIREFHLSAWGQQVGNNAANFRLQADTGTTTLSSGVFFYRSADTRELSTYAFSGINPDTGLAWTPAEVAALEFGVEAV